ncbi:MAG: hypothetical protein BGO26_12520 [Actinobacteria bacterium 69-20]|nr:MAG: hypothetical protein BGO26_12520 [Actinobacteria bacterium 69-20]
MRTASSLAHRRMLSRRSGPGRRSTAYDDVLGWCRFRSGAPDGWQCLPMRRGAGSLMLDR